MFSRGEAVTSAAAEREQQRRREARQRAEHVAGDGLLGLLDAVHLGADRSQPRERVVEPDGQAANTAETRLL